MNNLFYMEVHMLENRDDLLENKKAEICSIIEKTSILLCKENINSTDIMKGFLENGGLLITPPQQEPPTMHLIIMNSSSSYDNVQSIKPGNIKFNIRRVIEFLPDITASAVGIAMDIPILKICAALNIWKMLRNITTIEITKEQAMAIITLWGNCNQQHRITLEKGYDCFRTLYKNVEASECTWEQYMRVISDLEKIDSLKLDDEGIWLCEWVSKQYTK